MNKTSNYRTKDGVVGIIYIAGMVTGIGGNILKLPTFNDYGYFTC
jgi:hypothetical protein